MGSNETATTTTGGPRVIAYLTGTGCHRAQIIYFLWMQIGSRARSGLGLGSVSRLRRMRERFHRWIPMRTGAQLLTCLHHDPPKFSIQSSLESPKNQRMRSRRLPDPRPNPERAREPICIRKQCAIWARWRPVPVKTSIFPGDPVVAVAVSLDPILPHR